MPETNEWIDWDDMTPEQQQAILDAPCDMRYQSPFDFAWCDTHDTTFPLGSTCRFADAAPIAHRKATAGTTPDARDEALATARRINPESPLDLGIAHVVDLLITHGAPLGIGMVESCDASPGHSYPDPTVRINGTAGAAWHAVAICLNHGLPLRDLAHLWDIGPDGPQDPPTWELRFRPAVTGGLVTPPPAEFWSGEGKPNVTAAEESTP